jgi:hypothetical protein
MFLLHQDYSSYEQERCRPCPPRAPQLILEAAASNTGERRSGMQCNQLNCATPFWHFSATSRMRVLLWQAYPKPRVIAHENHCWIGRTRVALALLNLLKLTQADSPWD